MHEALYILTFAAFIFVVEIILVSATTKLMHFRGATVPRAAWATCCSYILFLILAVPLLFVIGIEGAVFDAALYILGFATNTVALKNIYRTKWPKAVLASAAVTIMCGLVIAVLGYIATLT